MKVIIDVDSPTPLFTQLIIQIKQAVSKGQLKGGDQLPSIRQLAADLRVNSKTVAKAFQLLERDSIIQSKGYRGTFVHPSALENCSVDLNAQVHETLIKVIKQFKTLGVTDSEIRIAFSKVMNTNLD